jgi:hypothetical protein
MAQINACDGCGAPEGEEALESFGISEVKEYCPDCAAIVTRFLEERDEIHDRAAALFRAEYNELWTSWKKQRPNGTLPDFRG